MKRNIYIAYALWFFCFPIGAGIHRIYCGKFVSGFLMLGLYWLGQITMWLLVGFVFLAIWAIWWIADVFLTQGMVERANSEFIYENDISNTNKIKSVEALYELYKNGAISQAEYEVRKDIIMRG